MGEVTIQHFIFPAVAVILAMIWMCIVVKNKGKDVIELTSKQIYGQKVKPIDVINKQQRDKNKPELDEEKFNWLYYRKLYKLRKEHPYTAFIYNVIDKIPIKYLDGIEEEILQESQQQKQNDKKKQE